MKSIIKIISIVLLQFFIVVSLGLGDGFALAPSGKIKDAAETGVKNLSKISKKKNSSDLKETEKPIRIKLNELKSQMAKIDKDIADLQKTQDRVKKFLNWMLLGSIIIVITSIPLSITMIFLGIFLSNIIWWIILGVSVLAGIVCIVAIIIRIIILKGHKKKLMPLINKKAEQQEKENIELAKLADIREEIKELIAPAPEELKAVSLKLRKEKWEKIGKIRDVEEKWKKLLGKTLYEQRKVIRAGGHMIKVVPETKKIMDRRFEAEERLKEYALKHKFSPYVIMRCFKKLDDKESDLINAFHEKKEIDLSSFYAIIPKNDDEAAVTEFLDNMRAIREKLTVEWTKVLNAGDKAIEQVKKLREKADEADINWKGTIKEIKKTRIELMRKIEKNLDEVISPDITTFATIVFGIEQKIAFTSKTSGEEKENTGDSFKGRLWKDDAERFIISLNYLDTINKIKSAEKNEIIKDFIIKGRRWMQWDDEPNAKFANYFASFRDLEDYENKKFQQEQDIIIDIIDYDKKLGQLSPVEYINSKIEEIKESKKINYELKKNLFDFLKNYYKEVEKRNKKLQSKEYTLKHGDNIQAVQGKVQEAIKIFKEMSEIIKSA